MAGVENKPYTTANLIENFESILTISPKVNETQQKNVPAFVLEEICEQVPSQDEILIYAESIGINIHKEHDLLYIAKEGICAPVPENWTVLRDSQHHVYYRHNDSGKTTWEHPLDDIYRRRVIEERKMLKLNQDKGSQTPEIHSSPRNRCKSVTSSLNRADLLEAERRIANLQFNIRNLQLTKNDAQELSNNPSSDRWFLPASPPTTSQKVKNFEDKSEMGMPQVDSSPTDLKKLQPEHRVLGDNTNVKHNSQVCRQSISTNRNRMSHSRDRENIPANVTSASMSFDANTSIRYLMEERNRLQQKLTYLKLTYKAYKLRLAAMDGNIKTICSMPQSSNFTELPDRFCHTSRFDELISDESSISTTASRHSVHHQQQFHKPTRVRCSSSSSQRNTSFRRPASELPTHSPLFTPHISRRL